jgi:hypothetical protein
MPAFACRAALDHIGGVHRTLLAVGFGQALFMTIKSTAYHRIGPMCEHATFEMNDNLRYPT